MNGVLQPHHNNTDLEMTSIPSQFLLASLATLSLCAQAAPTAGLSFSHNDWELACDNTRTCRAAGYQGSDGEEMAVSVLLTRKAGPGQPVTGQLMIGQYGDNDPVSKLPKTFKLAMRVNGKPVGQLALTQENLVADLSAPQVAALLASLSRASTIEWSIGDNRWQLSDKGASAVLLKMDEFQGRLGTQGALIKKGPRGEDSVLPPVPAPVLLAPALAKSLPSDAQFAKKHAKALRKALIASVKNENCPKLTEPEAGEGEAGLSVTRLSDSKLLVSTPCWMAAYNFGSGYWIIDNAPPFHPVLVTDSGSDYGDGTISASQKGRGLGDCWSSDAWTWDGKDFIHTESATTGMCRLLAPGGGWSLPTLVTDVRPAGR